MAGGPVWFCSNVGGGVFGGSQTGAWRRMGLDARLDYGVELADYWRAKSSAVRRLRLRWDMYVHYPWRLRRRVRRAGAGETFIAVTNPFFLPALAAGAAGGRVRVINLVFDLYPDALVFGGAWSERHPLTRLVERLTRRAIARCHGTVYLGERLRRHAEARYGFAPRTAVIPVGTDAAVFADAHPRFRAQRTVRVLYSGHMGNLHDWETAAGALAEGVPEGIEVEFAADGPAAMMLKRRLEGVRERSGGRLEFATTRGDDAWRTAMRRADVALVTMRAGAERVVMPSKTYSAMAAGQAVLAVCATASDLADLLRKHDCGWSIEPGDAAGLRAAFERLPRLGGELLGYRERAFVAAQAEYSMEAVGRRWLEWLEDVAGA